MANTFQYINKVQLASNVTSVTFSSIPQTYTDLLLICSGRSDVGGQGDGWRFAYNGTNNTDSSLRINAYADSSSTSLNTDTSNNFVFTSGNAWTANSFGVNYYIIPNYTSTSRAKVAIGSSYWGGTNPASGRGLLVNISGGLASGVNTTAVNSITITGPDSGGTNMLNGSTFYLYGITKA